MSAELLEATWPPTELGPSSSPCDWQRLRLLALGALTTSGFLLWTVCSRRLLGSPLGSQPLQRITQASGWGQVPPQGS